MLGRNSLLPILAITVLAGCNDRPANILDPLDPQFAEASSPQARPLTGFMEGYDEFAGLCTVGSNTGLELWTYGTGTLTHLGKTGLEQYTCFDPVNMAIYETWYILTAANGDVVRGGSTGVGFTPEGDTVLYMSIEGGTGRFENASGSMASTVVTSDADTWEGPVTGEIRY